MNKTKKILIAPLAVVLFFVLTLAAYAADAIQTFTGEVETSGSYTSTQNFEGEQTSERQWSFSGQGSWYSGNSVRWEGNTFVVSWSQNGMQASQYGTDMGLGDPNDYIAIEFDDEGNVLSWRHNGVGNVGYGAGNANVCEGDDQTCKQMTWGQLKIGQAEEIICAFTCAHRDVYSYVYQYEALRDGNWLVLDDEMARKCEDIRLQFNPDAEWFGTLDHVCSLGGGEKIITIDLISPPTDFSVCGDQQTCLTSATEYSLTDTTWGKGIQDIPTGFVENANNSMTGNNDPYLTCENSICTPYSSGNYTLAANAPESTYYGNCRGAAVEEDLDGNTITAPEVSIDTDPGVVPATNSTLPFYVENQAPITTMSIDKDNIAPNEEVTVRCDVVDPDDCVDEIVKVKWNCYDTDGNVAECQLNGNGTWLDGEYIQEGNYGNPANFTVGFRSPRLNTSYIVSCEAWDNDPRDPKSSKDNDQSIFEIGLWVSPDNLKTCMVLPVSGEKEKVECGDSAEIDFKAFLVGIDNPTYYWDCKNGEGENEGGVTQTCLYDTEGDYSPVLRIEEGNETVTDCISQSSVKVTTEDSCKVEVRKDGSSDSYESSISININDKVEARVAKECIETGDTQWESVNGTITSSDNDNAEVTFDKGDGTLKASVGEIQCSPASINVTEIIRWGT